MGLWVFINVLFAITFSFAATSQLTAVEDTYISETTPNTNYGSEIALLADGNDGSGGEIAALIKWDLSSIPSDATVTAASIILNLTDASSGAYNIIRQSTAWSEGTADWSDLSGSDTIRGVIPAFAIGQTTINLTPAGVNLVQGWIDGGFANEGVTIRTAGTTNGIDMNSREAGAFAPTLEVTYTGGTPTVESLQAQIDELKSLLAGVTRNGNDINFDGVNVRIRNGLGATNGNAQDPDSTTTTFTNGLGNLIVGYDELTDPYNGNGTPASDKSGSHNIVVGHGHNYSSFGGFVAGRDNHITEQYSSISGGKNNTARGIYSSISGGLFNNTSGDFSAISGGRFNMAGGDFSVISSGVGNTASGESSSVGGGSSNTASGGSSSISGGFANTASGSFASVTGGGNNVADGGMATVSGGRNRTAPNKEDWVAGALFEDN